MELLSVTMNDGVKPRSEIEGKDNSSEDKSNYKIVRKGDMVYNSMRMWQGANGISPCDGIVSPAYTVLMPKQEINNGYFAALFKSANLINEFRKNSQGMTSDTWNLKYPQIETIKIQIPSVSEQDKVSELFGVLDARIVAQAQLIEALKKYKRGSLSALFPKKGEITPQYRFAGFTKPWEQRKLGDMGSTFNGLSGKTKDDFGHGEAKFITYMNVFSNPIADLTMTESIEIDKKQKSVKAGDVFFTTSSETPDEVGMSSVMPEDADNIYLNSFCFGYRPTEKFDLNYLAYVLRADSFRKEMTFLAQGISRYNISKNKVMEVCIPVPTIEEQTKVGRYFRNLDNLITLHQHKYDTLLSLKNALLQQMFI